MPRPLHIHIEEPSMEAFLQGLLPRRLPDDLQWKIIDHGSKQQLLRELPLRLAGYRHHPPEFRPKILVAVDRDDDDCLALKARLENACQNADLFSKSLPAAQGGFDVVNRVVIEELEAWYFGDPIAVESEWTGTARRLNRAPFRDPDAIRGTHEAFLRVLQQAGHHRGLDRLPKIDTARRMGLSVDFDRNRSHSFQAFLTGLDALVEAV